MHCSAVAKRLFLFGSIAAIASIAPRAEAKTKHAGTPAVHTKSSLPATAQSGLRSKGGEAASARDYFSPGRPVVFHPGRTFAQFDLNVRGGRLAVHNGVFYSGAATHSYSKTGKMRYGSRYAYRYNYGALSEGDGSLQCVPFARAASGIELKGNAAEWWYAAAGVYERGNEPEPGSVLNFRSTGHMRLGHVAVVTSVDNPREIEIDHANWAGAGALKGGVARGVHVIDVSPENDWTAVRVALPNASGDYGSVYPTYGFIYDRPDNGTTAASTRQASFRGRANEVAEAPDR